MKYWLMVLLTITAALVSSLPVDRAHALEYDYDELSTEADSSESTSPSLWSFGFSSANFENAATLASGQIYTPGLVVYKKNEWSVGGEAPYLAGSADGERSQEWGNPSIHMRLKLVDVDQNFSIWLPGWYRLGQRGRDYRLASHHDTYRAGLDIEYKKQKLSTVFGAGYQLRTFEEDVHKDVGDIAEARILLRYDIISWISYQTTLQYYRVLPYRENKTNLTPTLDWAGVTPALAFHISDNLDLTTSVLYPILNTATPLETDLAFNEIYYPQATRISVAWGIGARF